MTVIAPDVAAYLGRKNDTATEEIAGEHVRVVTTFVRVYTRGNGFTDGEPNADLRDVIVSATARLTANPEQVQSHQIGEFAERPATFAGFTLPELMVLNAYRRRTA
jgi:hypothetical protein